MFQNYFKTALRNLQRNKLSSFINIGGLAVGMAVALLIGLWIWSELSYNHYHENYSSIARVMQNQTFSGRVQTWQSQANETAPELRNNYGQYFEEVVLTSFSQSRTLIKGNKRVNEQGKFMEAGGAEILGLTIVQGTDIGLDEPTNILISEKVAVALFGEEDPIDQSIELDGEDELKVIGVFEGLPLNSSFGEVEFVASWDVFAKYLPEWIGWGNNWFQVYVQVKNPSQIAAISESIKLAKYNRISDREKQYKAELFLHPMSQWNLYSDFENGVNVGGRIQYVWLFGIIGFFVLLLACINFMNLSTARSEKRAKEVGIRKTIGSNRGQLMGQFFSESILVCFLAFFLSLVFVQFLLPFFSEVSGKEVTLPWYYPGFWIASLGFCLLTGVLAGSYPALYLSSFQAVNALKGTLRTGPIATIPRKVLVVFQFTVSICLIIGTIVVFRQIQFAKDRPIGYEQDRLIMFPMFNEDAQNRYGTFKEELINTGVVESIASSESPVTQTFITNSGLEWKGKDPDFQDQFVSLGVSHEFGETIGWNITQGRDFSQAYPTDTMAFVINEAAVEYLGFENPIGEVMKWGDDDYYKVIGVVENMITQNPYSPTTQMYFYLTYDRMNYMNIRIREGVSTSDALAQIEQVYTKFDPIHPFEYQFIDQDYALKFGDEVRIGKLASFFAILAIFISCLGVFGMISFVAERRTKEIGIRKVLGASIAHIVGLLSREFLILVLIALLIAFPISWYYMKQWLDDFTFHIEIQWWVFALAGVLAWSIVLLTVSIQSIRAALANPVQSLRS